MKQYIGQCSGTLQYKAVCNIKHYTAIYTVHKYVGVCSTMEEYIAQCSCLKQDMSVQGSI